MTLLQQESRGEFVVLTVTCETLEAENVRVFREELQPYMSSPSSVVLDLRHVRFMDSSAVGAILSLRRSVQARGRAIALAGAGDAVFQILSLLHLDRLMGVYPSVEDAVRAIGGTETLPPTNT